MISKVPKLCALELLFRKFTRFYLIKSNYVFFNKRVPRSVLDDILMNKRSDKLAPRTLLDVSLKLLKLS